MNNTTDDTNQSWPWFYYDYNNSINGDPSWPFYYDGNETDTFLYDIDWFIDFMWKLNLSYSLGCVSGVGPSGKLVQCTYYKQWPGCSDVLLPSHPEDHPLRVARGLLYMLVPPFVIVLGILGNLTTVVVFLRTTTKMKSTVLFLLILAVSDTVFILTGVLNFWTTYMFGFDFENEFWFSCKTFSFIIYFTFHFSSWLLVAVTGERVLSVVIPHKVHTKCNKRNSIIVVVAIALTIALLNGHTLIFNELHCEDDKCTCSESDDTYTKLIADYWTWVHLSVVFVVPFIILLIGNVIIIRQLVKSNRQRKTMRAKKVPGENKDKPASSDSKSITNVLIGLSIVFFFSQAPSVYFIASPYLLIETNKLPCDKYDEYAYQIDLSALLNAFLNVLSFTNATINFYMYVLTGKKFRSEVKTLVCCKQPKTTEGTFSSRSSRRTVTEKF